MFEYVKESEYAPVRNELERILKRVQAEMRKKHKLTFQFQLIGSGDKHLVTRIRGGNNGYDFDYNLIIRSPQNNNPYNAKILKTYFMDAFKTALQETRYTFPKDSTSAITIKVVDKNKKKLCHSCDFAIIYYGKCGKNDGYYYLRNDKKRNTYEFAFRPLNPGIDNKMKDILKGQGWDSIEKEYLKLKNINERGKKHSYSIYIEAVNNVFNQMFLQ